MIARVLAKPSSPMAQRVAGGFRKTKRECTAFSGSAPAIVGGGAIYKAPFAPPCKLKARKAEIKCVSANAI